MRWKIVDDVLQIEHREKKLKPLKIDFIAVWQHSQIGKQSSLGKAVGARLGLSEVVDATAGLGRDTVRLLKMGLKVTACEQSSVIYALLADAQRRAEKIDWWNKNVAPRFTLNFLDATRTMPTAEVIYLDPMFPTDKKTAASSGEMQYLQEILQFEAQAMKQIDDGGEKLFIKGLQAASRRLVLKRPQHAPAWPYGKAQVVIKGQSVRYEVWLNNATTRL